jgi:hypothetical protein
LYIPGDNLARGSLLSAPVIPGGSVGDGLGGASCAAEVEKPVNKTNEKNKKPEQMMNTLFMIFLYGTAGKDRA